MKRKVLEIKPYPIDIELIQSTNDQIVDYLRKRFDYAISDEDVKYSVGMVFPIVKGGLTVSYYVIWSRDFDVATVAHECCHAAYMLLANYGGILNLDVAEHLCYWTDYFVEEFHKMEGDDETTVQTD